ncbi:MAG: hypothetical protein KBE65_10575 [Phycisphaerae bacterium]|nr:hypothetical protein [Phycisphaerae bacterium]
MRLLARYKKLNFWNKVGFWGAVASIVSLLAFFSTRDPGDGISATTTDSPGAIVQTAVNSPNSVQVAAGTVYVQQGSVQRRLSQATAKELVQILRGSSAQSVEFIAAMGNPEAYELADQLHKLFREAGWDVYPSVNQALKAGDIKGIHFVFDRKSPPSLEVQRAVVLILDEFGYEHAMYYGTPRTSMEVFVGRR